MTISKPRSDWLNLALLGAATLLIGACAKPPVVPDSGAAPGATQPVDSPAAPADLKPATEVTAVDLDGNAVKLSDLKGKPVVVDFWATWCPPCREAMPVLAELQKDLADTGLVIVAVSTDDAVDAPKQYAADNPSDLTMWWMDPAAPETKQIAEAYELTAIPTTIFIDKDGNVVHREQGFGGKDAYLEALAKLGVTSG